MLRRNTVASLESLESRRLLAVDFGWGLGGGSNGVAGADAVVTDTDGSVFVAGHFSGTIDVDPSKKQNILTATGSRDMFVIKYSADRKLIWAKQWAGGTGEIYPTAMAINPYSTINDSPDPILYVVGSFTGAGDMGTSHGGEDAFIQELHANNGGGIAHSYFGGPGYDAARTVDGSHGDPLIGGVFSKTANFAQAGNLTSYGGKDGFVLLYLYDADVNHAFQIGGAGDDAINQLIYDGTNQVNVVGTMTGLTHFGKSKTIKNRFGRAASIFLTGRGGKDAFYARYNSGFKNVFAKQYGGPGDDFGDTIARGYSGTYIAGTFVKPMAGLTSTGGRDIFIQQIGGAAQDIGSVADDAIGKLAIDPIGKLIVTGRYGAPLTFNGTTLRNEGSTDVFLARYDTGFSPTEIVSLGGQYTDTTTALSMGPKNVVCLAGSFQRWIDLGPGDISAPIYGNANGEFWLERLIVS